MKRRIMLKLAVFLLLGAIVNVAVAWGCALLSPFELTLTLPNGIIPTDEIDKSWISRSGWQPEPDDQTYTSEVIVLNTRRGAGILLHEYAEDRILKPRAKPSEGPSTWAGLVFACQTRSGWPALALAGGHILAKPSHLRFDGRYSYGKALDVFSASKFAGITFGRNLPLRPVWPGFALNTIFYPVMLWLLFAAPFKLRRHIRMKRKCCPGCGYPIGTSPVCTECGVPVTPTNVAPPTPS